MRSTAPAPLRNLVPNPALGANTTGWTTHIGAASASRVSYSGSFWYSVFPTASATQTYAAAPITSVSPSTSYALTAVVDSGGVNITQAGFIFQWMDGSGALIGPDGAALGTPGVLKRFSYVGKSPSNAAFVRIFPFVKFGKLGDRPNFLTSQIMVAPSTTVPPYFDGGYTDTTAANYSWDGTANNSTSTLAWTAPTLGVSSGMVRGGVYGRSAVTIRRSGAVTMSSLPFMRIRGTATAAPKGQIVIADQGANVSPSSYSYNASTGAFEILISRPGGFAAVDVTFDRTDGVVSTGSSVFVAVDSIDITDNPFATGKTQTRQVQIYGSQRTELSLSVLGLDAAGTSAVGLGEQVLVYTASAGDDGRAKFLACRSDSTVSAASTSDSSAVSGAFNALPTTTTPLGFTFPTSSLLTGTYLAVARVRSATAGTSDLSFRAFVDPSVGDNVYDPRTGWKTAPLTVAASGAAWPSANTNAWVMVPLGLLRLPPADVEDSAATITVQLARGANAADVDDVFLLNTDVGQSSILLTGLTAGSYSAVRLDAATVDAAQATAWVGVANGTMLADAARWIGEQHAAAPGLLQIATVTPGCATSRVSASYYPRFHTHVASVAS
jgi:hypothetical protein